MSNPIQTAVTFIEAVKESLLAAGRYNTGDAVAPAAILWTDADGEWRPLAARRRELMPELLTLGPFEPEQRTGPAIWLRCAIEGVLEDVKLPANSIPVLYLPKVSRQLLRSPEDCGQGLPGAARAGDGPAGGGNGALRRHQAGGTGRRADGGVVWGRDAGCGLRAGRLLSQDGHGICPRRAEPARMRDARPDVLQPV
jgi:hypothetical protein